jgi:hypothetical protein
MFHHLFATSNCVSTEKLSATRALENQCLFVVLPVRLRIVTLDLYETYIIQNINDLQYHLVSWYLVAMQRSS